ncbi:MULTISPECIES: GNAT family N-acetyltransferase [Microbacterium]|uniref:GNAT family N-acetyltransferase n=1 Tax=Microbacterium TaxID=33882 RepID=UPI0020BE2037|nr:MULTISPECIES: GNAT family N-acetyltransferase [Microbacterium]MCK8478248.1 GNAT family N-acetyltransferase [Microbacterium aurugineum]UUE20124.1 GNAT family N-acetyltransferase [Microbacterium sp. J1-1]
MSPLVVREAGVDDADEVARVHVRSWQAAYRGLIDQSVLDGLSIAERATGWRRLITDPLPTTLGLLVAERDDRIVGWTSFGSGRDPDGLADAEVYGIYADPDAWSTGAGHALLDAAEQRMADAGHARAYLWVLDGNVRADTFYARHGWIEDGAIKIEERPGFTLCEHRRVKLLAP